MYIWCIIFDKLCASIDKFAIKQDLRAMLIFFYILFYQGLMTICHSCNLTSETGLKVLLTPPHSLRFSSSPNYTPWHTSSFLKSSSSSKYSFVQTFGPNIVLHRSTKKLPRA